MPDSVVLRSTCSGCQGTKIDQNRRYSVGAGTSLDDLKCHTCHGTGFTDRYVTVDQLFEAMLPHFLEAAVRELPNLVVRSIMNC